MKVYDEMCIHEDVGVDFMWHRNMNADWVLIIVAKDRGPSSHLELVLNADEVVKLKEVLYER